MQIFLGSFHPHLEKAFVAEIQKFKTPDPLRPLLILVPSDLIRRRLQSLLTLEHELNLVQFSILTFHQLSMKLCEESRPSGDFSTKGDLFFEEVLRLQIQQLDKTHPALAGLEETEGGSAALWQCLRDLKDGLVDAEVVLSALNEGHFAQSDRKKLSALFHIYRQMQACSEAYALLSYGDLAILATQAVPNSPFLSGFDGIFYYGFYDLTQVQIDLFQAVTRYYDTTLFFPLVRKNADWDFSNRFYERYVEGLVNDASQVCDLTRNPSHLQLPVLTLFDETESETTSPHNKEKPATTLINCYDIRDEVLVTAKEIVRLVSDEGVQFHEIGVVARDPTPYLSHILSLFQNHAIPITTNCKTPLLQHPYALYTLLFMNLPIKNYTRAQCVDLLSSPYFEIADPSKGTPVPDKTLWALLSKQAGVDKGHQSWQRLADSSSSPQQAALLLKIFNRLHDELHALPPSASYSDYASAFQSLLEKYLGLVIPEEKGLGLKQEDRVKKGIGEILEGLAGLDFTQKNVSLQDFIKTFERWLNRATIAIGDRNVAGVSVLGTMSARGLPFRFLFLLGLNEGTFPRSIREDPFLPDQHRRVLETVLGYKVGEKLAGYDEERLLLSLMASAARERLFALYHRVGGESGTASPSWYLGHLAASSAQDAKTLNERLMPRGLLERQQSAPFNRFDLLLPHEIALLFSLSRWPLAPLLKTLPFSSAHYQAGHHVLRQLESTTTLTHFDGLCGPIDKLTTAIKKEGITPTSLEKYALCPFQFFADKVLKLRPIEAPEEQADLPILDAGKLCHAILNAFYDRLKQGDFFERATDIIPHQILSEVCSEVFQKFENKQTPRYPLLWQEMKMQLAAMLSQVIALDLQSLSQSGDRPVAFEVKCSGSLEPEWPQMWGYLDRIDFNQEDGRVRVVDYKYTLRKQPKTGEKNLALSAIRGEKLQAPIYQKLAEIYGDEREGEAESGTRSAFYFLAPNWPDGPLVVREFPEDGWQGEAGVLLKETISLLLEGINTGRFFMMPNEACSYCKVAIACRLNHLPSRRRLEHDDSWQAHQMLGKKKLPKKSGK